MTDFLGLTAIRTDFLGIDYSYTHPDPAAIVNAGYQFVLRYVPTGFAGKDVTAAEIKALHAAGLQIGFIYETTAQRAVAGSPAGAADGNQAKSELLKLGVPANTPLFINVGDWAATPDEINAIHGYYYQFRQAQKNYYAQGGYATSYIIDKLIAQGAEGLWWQNAMNDQGVSGSAVNARANIYQRVSPTLKLAGGGFDENIVVNPHGFAFWKPTATTVSSPAANPNPVVVPTTKVIKSVTVNFSDGTSEVIT